MNRSTRLTLDTSFENFEAQLAQSLGLSCSLSMLRRACANLTARKAAQAKSEKEQLRAMLAGKKGAERVALVRANKDRIRECLGLRGNSGKPIHRRSK